MTLKRRDAGAWVDIATALKRRSGGSWVDVDFIKRRVAGTWSVIWSRVNITDQSITRSAALLVTAGYRLNSSGIAERKLGSSYSTIETWLALGSASSYEVRATIFAGDSVTVGPLGTWVGLGSSREWTVTSPSGIASDILFVEIRNASTLAVVDSAYISLTAEKT